MKIRKFVIQTARPGELEEFYSRVLELPAHRNATGQLVVATGSSELVFTPVTTGDPFYHFAFNIPANKIEEARAWLQGRVPLIWMNDNNSDIADFASWHARSVYFYDPAGNIVELIARFDLDNAKAEPFSSRQILSISEVGLVVPDAELDQRTGELLQQYKLSYFDKQAPLPRFRAVGDDEGLFIVVPENRNWYPTPVASGMYPMEVEFSNGEEYKLIMP